MIDHFGRIISYLRLSVTDRCDLRCTYCMPERMAFAPRAELLGLDELDRLAAIFIRKGARKVRLTGGEPLARKGIIDLVTGLSRFLRSGELDELTLTTNGTQLARHAESLAKGGIKRINVSLDSLDRDTYAQITRGGRLDAVLDGIRAAASVGLKIKINAIALKNDNLDQLVGLAEWAHGSGHEITMIEVMPLGDVEAARIDQHVPLTEVRRRLQERWVLTDLARSTGGPARYVRTAEGGIIGFITPLSRNFCSGCNRVRVTATGEMFMCLGQSARADLRGPLRSGDDRLLDAAIDEAIARKPHGHEFVIAAGAAAAVPRHMSVTGG